jgi:hypothetical protein
MATLRYDGLVSCPSGMDPKGVSAPVAGIGWVKVGQTFEVDEARALELLGKTADHIFVRIEEKPLGQETKAAVKKGK